MPIPLDCMDFLVNVTIRLQDKKEKGPKPMKKKWIATLSISALVLTACQTDDGEETETETTEEVEEVEAPETEGEEEGSEETTEEDSEPEEETEEPEYELSQELESWIPMHENVVLEYDGGSFENAGFSITPQFTLEDTYQFANSDTATTTVEIYEYTEDAVVRNFTRMETYFRDNFVDTGLASEGDGGAMLLQLPIEVGNTWESDNGSVYEITDSHVSIETEAGTFEAIEVTSTSEDGENVARSYYAEDVGLVQRESEVDHDDEPMVSTLQAIHEDRLEEINFSFYSPNEGATGLESQPIELQLATNDPARVALAEALQGNHEETEGNGVIEDSVVINFMYLDNEDVAHVDFSEELVTEMNYGTTGETLMLQSIVNTIASYYGSPVEEVLLTVEEEPYMSGHIVYEEGETMQVDEEIVEE